jgi:hypothetical protein
MARGDWTYVAVNNELAGYIDKFLESEDARNMSLKNRQQFVNKLIIEFFRKYKENVGASYVKYTTYTDILDLVEPSNKKTRK